jgi:hypothetical protein
MGRKLKMVIELIVKISTTLKLKVKVSKYQSKVETSQEFKKPSICKKNQ